MRMAEMDLDWREQTARDEEPGPDDMPSAAELAQQARWLDPEDGPFHAGGRFYKNPDDADRARREIQEREAERAERRMRWQARHGLTPERAA